MFFNKEIQHNTIRYIGCTIHQENGIHEEALGVLSCLSVIFDCVCVGGGSIVACDSWLGLCMLLHDTVNLY